MQLQYCITEKKNEDNYIHLGQIVLSFSLGMVGTKILV